MADENLEGLEGLDDFGDDFGDQLDSFMEGDEDEGKKAFAHGYSI